LSPFELSVRFFLQMTAILLACRVVGALFKALGQPQVVGEMTAGILMGPSLFGWLAPGAHGFLFPDASKPILFAAAQLGVVLYMFVVGLEFNVELIRPRLRGVAIISLAGIAVPFTLGGLLALKFAGDPDFFSAGVTQREAVLYLGASMSITAFPMLARIILEQGLAGTRIGTLALAAGSLDDAAAWCILAVVLATYSATPSIAVLAIGGGLLFAAFTLLVLRPLLAKVVGRFVSQGGLGSEGFSGALMLVMLAAWFTDYIRLYAVFGAFLTGIAMPRGAAADQLREKILPLTSAFLLPVFFVFTGLNTRIGLVSTPALWLSAAVVVAAASLGKAGACSLAARWTGENWRDSMGIGALMNARGLMELIILNIGLERGIIQPPFFAIMVMMAVITTLMSTPMFWRAYGRRPVRAERPVAA
jgi:Kef-type K+ transport system membrane component KefB